MMRPCSENKFNLRADIGLARAARNEFRDSILKIFNKYVFSFVFVLSISSLVLIELCETLLDPQQQLLSMHCHIQGCNVGSQLTGFAVQFLNLRVSQVLPRKRPTSNK